MAIDPDKPHAFLSYTRDDDVKFFKGGISWLREELEQLVSGYIGEPFQIFQDTEDIQPSDRWEHKLDQALRAAQLFIPILTPRFFQSDFCRREAKAFLDYEERAGRAGLILPLYFIRTPKFDNPAIRDADNLAKALYARQYADWRAFAVKLQRQDTRSKLTETINQLAETIAATVEQDVLVPDVADEPEREESSSATSPPAVDDSYAFSAESELDFELQATRAKLAELERQRIEELRYWQEKEMESEEAVAAALAEADREKGAEAQKRQGLEREKRQLEEELKASRAQAAKLEKLEAENQRIRSAAEASSSGQDDNAVMSRWPHRRPMAIAASIALLVGATGALGFRNLSSSDQTDQLLAELEQLRTERSASEAAAREQVATMQAELESAQTKLAAAENTIEGLSQETAAGPLEPGQSFQDCDFCPEMVVIPAGKFMMGSPAGEEGRYDDEGPRHEVTIGAPFAIGKYEVTFEEYDRFAEVTERDQPYDKGWGRGRRPVINVNWEDANAYCAWLNEQTGKTYRLPSEAEWEYAARAGTATRYAFGDKLTAEQANFGLAIGKTTEVGGYQANNFGLLDMHGNVREWVEDVYQGSYEGAPADGSAWLGDGSDRVVRGGSWYFTARFVRSAYRNGYVPGARYDILGFRCAGVQEPAGG